MILKVKQLQFFVYLLIVSSYGRPLLTFTPATLQITNIAKTKQPLSWWSYRITHRNIFSARVMEQMQALKKYGFSGGGAPVTNHNFIRYDAVDGKSVCLFNAINSNFIYRVMNVPELSGSNTANTNQLLAKSKEYLRELTGNDTTYRYFTTEKQWRITYKGKSSEKKLRYITFRYVKYLDGRPVMNNIAAVRIMLGRDGCLKEYDIREPEITRVSVIQTPLKLESAKNYIEQYTSSNAFQYTTNTDNQDTAILVQNVMESYAVDSSDPTLLVPAITFSADHVARNVKSCYGLHTIRSNDIAVLGDGMPQ